MLNDINSTSNVPVKSETKKIDSCLLSLKDDINCLQNQITDLTQQTTSERVIADSVTSDSVNARTAVIDGSLVSGSLDSTDINAQHITTTTLGADDLHSNTIGGSVIRASDRVDTKDLNVTGTFQASDFQTSNVTTADLEVTRTANVKCLCACRAEVCCGIWACGNSEFEGMYVNGDLNSCGVIADYVQATRINAFGRLEASNAVLGGVTRATTISTMDLKASDYVSAPKIENEQVEGTGKINIQPNLDLSSQWVSIKIPHTWQGKRWSLAGHWHDSNGNYTWSVSGIGSEQTDMIAWNETALETIKDFSFDKTNGDLYIRVRAEDNIVYHTTYVGEDYTLTAVVDGPCSTTLYAPETLRGYLFQSYNDDSTAFYFGGQVKLHSLKAEVQDFDWATYKYIGIQNAIRVPESYDNEGQVSEWTTGDIGDYLTYREVDFGGTLGKIVAPVWETPTIFINELNKEKLVKAEAFAEWDGSYELTDHTLTYPLTELGDKSTIHGSVTVNEDEQVKGNFETLHIQDGQVSKTAAEMPDGSLVRAEKTVGTHDKVQLVYDKDGKIIAYLEAQGEGNTWAPTNLMWPNRPNDIEVLKIGEKVPLVFNDGSDGTVSFKRYAVQWSKLYGFKHVIATGGYVHEGWYQVHGFWDNSDPDDYTPSTPFSMPTKATAEEENTLNNSPWLWMYECPAEDWNNNDYVSGFTITGAKFAILDSSSTAWTRKTTEDNNAKYDRLAVYESTAELEDNKPLVFDEAHESIKTTDTITIDEGNFDHINVAHDAVIGGDLYVKGTTHTVDEETISTGSDNIVLRQNAESALPANQLSGVIVNNYDGDGKVSIIGSDNTGTVRVGTAETTSSTYAEIYLKDGKWYSYDSDTQEYTEETVTGELVGYASKSITEDNYTKYEDAVFASFSPSDTVPILGRDEEHDMIDQSLLYWDGSTWVAKSVGIPVRDEQVLESHYETVDDVPKLSYRWVDKKPGVFRFATVADYNTYKADHNIPENSIVVINGNNNYIYSEDVR